MGVLEAKGQTMAKLKVSRVYEIEIDQEILDEVEAAGGMPLVTMLLDGITDVLDAGDYEQVCIMHYPTMSGPGRTSEWAIDMESDAYMSEQDGATKLLTVPWSADRIRFEVL